jgi:hypothetical protein
MQPVRWRLFVRRDVYPQYACRGCETITVVLIVPP